MWLCCLLCKAYLGLMVQRVRVRGGEEVVGGRRQAAGAAAESSHLGPHAGKENPLEMARVCATSVPPVTYSPNSHQPGTRLTGKIYFEPPQVAACVRLYCNCWEPFSFSLSNFRCVNKPKTMCHQPVPAERKRPTQILHWGVRGAHQVWARHSARGASPALQGLPRG